MVIRISDKTQNYSKVTKLLVKPKINLNLHIMFCLGWYVLGAMILNELRSIIKNLIQLHVFVPKIFKKCLQEIEDYFK